MTAAGVDSLRQPTLNPSETVADLPAITEVDVEGLVRGYPFVNINELAIGTSWGSAGEVGRRHRSSTQSVKVTIRDADSATGAVWSSTAPDGPGGSSGLVGRNAVGPRLRRRCG